MNRLALSLIGAALLLSACTSPADTAGTAQAQTQAAQGSLSTALVGTLTAIAPTATHTPPPPTATPPSTATMTLQPSPTPSGKFGFFDVAVKQVNDNEVAVMFGFQIQKGVKLDGLMIGARPEGCTGAIGKESFTPFVPGSSTSGIVSEQDAIRMQYRIAGVCKATGITLFLFRNGGSDLYSAKFDATFSLEMK